MIFLGLGTNLGDKVHNLNLALHKLTENRVYLEKASTFYETEPWGFAEQDSFLNAVVLVQFEGTAFELLDIVLQIEMEMGRIRTQKWGPRIIDIDILEFNREIIQTERLTLPHPYYTQREFVMIPLLEIVPSWVP